MYYATYNNILNVYVVSDLDQLCMKATAWRRKDISDVKFLVSKLKQGGYTYENFLRQFEYLYRGKVIMKPSAEGGIRRLFLKK